jgi:hypothetical protein
MLARSSFEYFEVPESTNFGAIEPFRERTFVHPLLFVPRRLANFGVTRGSARPTDPADWIHAVTVLTGTFVSDVSLSRDQIAALWADARKPPRWTHVLFVCAWHFARCRPCPTGFGHSPTRRDIRRGRWPFSGCCAKRDRKKISLFIIRAGAKRRTRPRFSTGSRTQRPSVLPTADLISA